MSLTNEQKKALWAANAMRNLSPFEREVLIRAAGDKVVDIRHLHPTYRPLNA